MGGVNNDAMKADLSWRISIDRPTFRGKLNQAVFNLSLKRGFLVWELKISKIVENILVSRRLNEIVFFEQAIHEVSQSFESTRW